MELFNHCIYLGIWHYYSYDEGYYYFHGTDLRNGPTTSSKDKEAGVLIPFRKNGYVTLPYLGPQLIEVAEVRNSWT